MKFPKIRETVFYNCWIGGWAKLKKKNIYIYIYIFSNSTSLKLSFAFGHVIFHRKSCFLGHPIVHRYLGALEPQTKFVYAKAFSISTLFMENSAELSKFRNKFQSCEIAKMTGYAGSRDYVGNPQSPWRTSRISVYPTEK